MLEKIIKNIEKDGHKVLYVTEFGSHLYGLNDKYSDKDYKGIYLPSEESLILQKTPENFNYSSGSDSGKNCKDDIDIIFFSLHKWLNKVQTGEVNALDLLFSHTNKNCVIYKDDCMTEIFDNHSKLFDSNITKAYLGYAIGQVKRYGMRGTRLGIIKSIKEFIENIEDKNNVLSDYIDLIVDKFGKEKLCFKKNINGIEALIVCDKAYLGTIKFKDFKNNMNEKYKKYGTRAEKAMENNGIDWKAVSHAYRALVQVKEILLTGKVEFPLTKDRDIIYDIKKGKKNWTNIEPKLLGMIEDVESIDINKKCKYNKSFVENIILSKYSRRK